MEFEDGTRMLSMRNRLAYIVHEFGMDCKLYNARRRKCADRNRFRWWIGMLVGFSVAVRALTHMQQVQSGGRVGG